MAQDALSADAWPAVEVRPTIPLDMSGIAKRGNQSSLTLPDETDEQEVTSRYVSRPPVIPMRSSTPVTALETSKEFRGFANYGPGLGLARGNLAHQAIEQWFTSGRRPSLEDMARSIDDGLSDEEVDRLTTEVNDMLDWLDASPLAKTIRGDDTERYFEMPFTWDWDGIPVHGTIDLVYRNGSGWHVIDFKTDDVRGRPVADVSERYLPQLALYREALKRATGETPKASLVFCGRARSTPRARTPSKRPCRKFARASARATGFPTCL